MDQASYIIKQLCSSFRLRGVVEPAEEPLYTDEYLSFVDGLRRLHADLQQPKLLIAVEIDFISRQDALKTRRHLVRIFRLCCLCLDEPRFSFPAIRFGSIKTDDQTCSMFDIVAPIQSFLGSVSRGLDALTSDSSVSRLLNWEHTFANTGLDSTCSPCDSLVHFGQQQVREGINSCHGISTLAGTTKPGSIKSPKVFRVSPGKSATQRSAPESEEASISKSSNLSGKSANL